MLALLLIPLMAEGSIVWSQISETANPQMQSDFLRQVVYRNSAERVPSNTFENQDVTHYGPPVSQPRGTLMQWSYGTSFSGGPDLDAPLLTDRPSFTSASTTVGRGVLQVETGYLYTTDLDGTTRTTTHAVPETLVRLGMFAEWFEFRLAQNLVGLDNSGFTDLGGSDTFLGASIALTGQEGILPEIALLPGLTLPTGSRSVSSGTVLPFFAISYGWDVNDRWSLGGNVDVANDVDSDSGATYVSYATSFYASVSVTEKLAPFAEFFNLMPVSAQTVYPEYYFDGGLMYLITKDIQWDCRVGMGLNQPADDFFTGTGLSIRFR